jgi:PleD family two-component response regulator
MATGVDDARLGVEAMRLGADDYLIKPLPQPAWQRPSLRLVRKLNSRNIGDYLDGYTGTSQ